MKFLQYKNIISVICLILIASFTSCDETADELEVSDSEPVTLSELEITEIELDQSNPNNPAATFTWTKADYGQPTVENYALEFSSDESFENFVVASVQTRETNVSLNMSEINSASADLGLPPSEWNTMYARITSSLGSESDLKVSSNAISFEVYPYFNYPYKDYFLVGNATAAGWNNSNNNPVLFRDASDPNLYRYTGFFQKNGGINEGRFKVIETKGFWQPQWGTTFNEPDDPIETTGAIASNPITQDSDPGRFGVESEGYYTFTIDFGDGSYSMEPFDASNAPEFTSITLQGSGISTDTQMNQLSLDPHIWFLNNVSLMTGGVQFETNTGATWGGDTAFSGMASENGPAIDIVVADDYNVWFNDLTGEYIFIPQNF
jgi:hypothetical protein